ncbi:MAG: hypothetical protein KIT48_19995 [Pseudolabrys sp.]|jgi:hypothetical protein|nr:hypothetical protein [Pseudolabrys sp.]
MTMNDHPLPSEDNVVSLDAKVKSKDSLRDSDRQGLDAKAVPGGKDDPRMQEAVRLMEAFLAIDDSAARNALVTLAEQLVSHDWARRGLRRS